MYFIRSCTLARIPFLEIKEVRETETLTWSEPLSIQILEDVRTAVDGRPYGKSSYPSNPGTLTDRTLIPGLERNELASSST